VEAEAKAVRGEAVNLTRVKSGSENERALLPIGKEGAGAVAALLRVSADVSDPIKAEMTITTVKAHRGHLSTLRQELRSTILTVSN
jgi:hypothetical protein